MPFTRYTVTIETRHALSLQRVDIAGIIQVWHNANHKEIKND